MYYKCHSNIEGLNTYLFSSSAEIKVSDYLKCVAEFNRTNLTKFSDAVSSWITITSNPMLHILMEYRTAHQFSPRRLICYYGSQETMSESGSSGRDLYWWCLDVIKAGLYKSSSRIDGKINIMQTVVASVALKFH